MAESLNKSRMIGQVVFVKCDISNEDDVKVILYDGYLYGKTDSDSTFNMPELLARVRNSYHTHITVSHFSYAPLINCKITRKRNVILLF